VGLALCVAAERLLATRGERPVTVGLLCGAAWGAKYTALPGCAGIGFAAALLRRGSPSARLAGTAVVGAVTLVTAAAWTARSFMLTGSPLYPAFHGVLGGRYWDPQSAAVVAETVSHGGLANRGISAFFLALVDLLAHSDTLGFPSGINPLFVVGGLIGLLLWKRVRGGGALLVIAATTYVGWCATSLNLRYALILLAVLAPFAGAAIQAVLERLSTSRGGAALRPVAALLLLLVVSGPFVSAVGRHLQAYGDGTPFLGGDSRSEMQVTRLHMAAAGRELARELPEDARILLVGEGRVGLLPRPAVASSAYDRPDIARLIEGARDVAELNRRLAGFTHVVINHRELNRFVERFDFEQRFGPGEYDLFRRWLAEGLVPLRRFGNVAVYEIPRRPPRAGVSGPATPDPPPSAGLPAPRKTAAS
jgi:hypothetical protein